MKTPFDFRNEVLGKAFDIDGAYGAQCWDGYAYYMKWLGYSYASCTSSGYVKDIWNDRKTNGILNACMEVESMQQGDIAVFREVAGITPYSHIAIFMKDNKDGTGVFLGQNQGGVNGEFNEISLPYSATFATAFRPKCYKDLLTVQKKPKYKVGLPVCTNTLASSSTGGNVYKGDWEGVITKVIEGAPYPYLLNDNTGWTNDEGIDSDPHTPSNKGQQKEVIYNVRSGDTLSAIAHNYGTTYQELAVYNGISNPNVIQVGQQIKIPK